MLDEDVYVNLITLQIIHALLASPNVDVGIVGHKRTFCVNIFVWTEIWSHEHFVSEQLRKLVQVLMIFRTLALWDKK